MAATNCYIFGDGNRADASIMWRFQSLLVSAGVEVDASTSESGRIRLKFHLPTTTPFSEPTELRAKRAYDGENKVEFKWYPSNTEHSKVHADFVRAGLGCEWKMSPSLHVFDKYLSVKLIFYLK